MRNWKTVRGRPRPRREFSLREDLCLREIYEEAYLELSYGAGPVPDAAAHGGAGRGDGGDGVSLLGLSPRQEPPYGGCAPKHACGRRPAHTLHPQGVCSIRRAAKPLTAALPYRRGEFSTLSTDSFITLNGVVPILGQLHVYSGKIDICDRFAMQKHRRMKNVRFPRPCGATGNDTRKLHAPALRIFMARCSCVKFFA